MLTTNDLFPIVYQLCTGVGPPLHFAGCRRVHNAVILGLVSEQRHIMSWIEYWELSEYIYRAHGQSDVKRLLAPCAARRMTDV